MGVIDDKGWFVDGCCFVMYYWDFSDWDYFIVYCDYVNFGFYIFVVYKVCLCVGVEVIVLS